jgi:hypothetical protein
VKYDFTSLVTWLNDQVNKASFADVSINLKIHDGKITLIEKSISEKSKLLTGNTGDCYGKK